MASKKLTAPPSSDPKKVHAPPSSDPKKVHAPPLSYAQVEIVYQCYLPYLFIYLLMGRININSKSETNYCPLQAMMNLHYKSVGNRHTVDL